MVAPLRRDRARRVSAVCAGTVKRVVAPSEERMAGRGRSVGSSRTGRSANLSFQ